MRLLVVLVCALLVSVCQRQNRFQEEAEFVEAIKARARAGEPRQLASGRVVRILDKSLQDRTLELTYLASVNEKPDYKITQLEVEEIWIDFLRVEAEEAGASTVYVIAETLIIDEPSVVGAHSAEFKLERSQSGAWNKLGGFAFSPDELREVEEH